MALMLAIVTGYESLTHPLCPLAVLRPGGSKVSDQAYATTDVINEERRLKLRRFGKYMDSAPTLSNHFALEHSGDGIPSASPQSKLEGN